MIDVQSKPTVELSERERQCFDKIVEYASIPPDRPSFRIRQEIEKFAEPGMYKTPGGHTVQIYGPVQAARYGDPSELFVVRGRYITGEQYGEVFSVPFFGKEGFLCAYRAA